MLIRWFRSQAEHHMFPREIVLTESEDCTELSNFLCTALPGEYCLGTLLKGTFPIRKQLEIPIDQEEYSLVRKFFELFSHLKYEDETL